MLESAIVFIIHKLAVGNNYIFTLTFTVTKLWHTTEYSCGRTDRQTSSLMDLNYAQMDYNYVSVTF